MSMNKMKKTKKITGYAGERIIMSNNNERLTYKNMEIIGIDHGFGQMKSMI